MIPVVPLPVQRAIVQHVPRNLAYVPTQLPVGWRYRGWDTGGERPGVPRGLNIWFTTRHPSGAGFHTYHDRRCTLKAMRRFRIGSVVVAWVNDFGDDQVWRCIRSSSGMIRLSLSYIGLPSATSLRVDARHAVVFGRILATLRHLK